MADTTPLPTLDDLEGRVNGLIAEFDRLNTFFSALARGEHAALKPLTLDAFGPDMPDDKDAFEGALKTRQIDNLTHGFEAFSSFMAKIYDGAQLALAGARDDPQLMGRHNSCMAEYASATAAVTQIDKELYEMAPEKDPERLPRAMRYLENRPDYSAVADAELQSHLTHNLIEVVSARFDIVQAYCRMMTTEMGAEAMRHIFLAQARPTEGLLESLDGMHDAIHYHLECGQFEMLSIRERARSAQSKASKERRNKMN